MRRAVAGLFIVCLIVTGCASNSPAKTREPGPTRVLLMGDSITAWYSPTATTALKAKGYAVTQAGVGGSGLLDQNVWDGAHARQLRRTHPDVVVVEYTGNYGPLLGAPVGVHRPLVRYGSEKWFRLWHTSAERLTRTFKGARVIWVQVPTLWPGSPYERVRETSAAVPRLNAMYRSFGRTIDAWSAFGGTRFDPTLHQADGVHPSPAGIQILAGLVVKAVG